MIFLLKIGTIASDKCSLCFLEKKTILHLFYNCNISKNVWLGLYSWLNLNNIDVPYFSADMIIFGNYKSQMTNIIILATKYYIYLCRCCKNTVSLTDRSEKLFEKFI